jgi:hypothetical protein
LILTIVTKFLIPLLLKKRQVMTSRLQRGDRLFNSGLAHFFSSMINGFKSVLFSCLWISLHRSS